MIILIDAIKNLNHWNQEIHNTDIITELIVALECHMDYQHCLL